MLLESDLIPFAVAPPVGNRSLILAPHPDDETLGCGGTISLLLKSKKDLKVVFLTSGDKADPSHRLSQIAASVRSERCQGGSAFQSGPHVSEYSLLREKEAVRALKVLGVSDYEFLRFPDRELNTHYESALARLLEISRGYVPDAIYSPSIIELNPDHRTTASLALDIQKALSDGRGDASSCVEKWIGSVSPRVIFYEVTTPLRPNILVDVTSVYKIKERAVRRYVSQLKLTDYLRHVTAMNTMRSLTVKNPRDSVKRSLLRCRMNGPRYVEAFWSLDQPLNEVHLVKWLSYRASSTK